MFNLTKIPSYVLIGGLVLVLLGAYEFSSRHKAVVQPKTEVTTVIPPREETKDKSTQITKLPEIKEETRAVIVENKVESTEPVSVEPPVSTKVETPVTTEIKPVEPPKASTKAVESTKKVVKKHTIRKPKKNAELPTEPATQQNIDNFDAFFKGLFNID